MHALTELHWTKHAAMPLLLFLQVLPLVGAGLLLALRERPWAEQLGRAFSLPSWSWRRCCMPASMPLRPPCSSPSAST